MKLTRKEAITALLFGVAGTVIGQDKLEFTQKSGPTWMVCDADNVKGVRLRKGDKEIEITMDEIWEALQ